MNNSLVDYDDENANLPKNKSRHSPNDSTLNAEMINFNKLDHLVEGESKRRGQAKVVAAKIELSPRDKIRLNKHLRDTNIMKKAQEQTKSVSPLRHRQQQAIEKKNSLKRKGMIGELEKIFGRDDESGEEEEALLEGEDEQQQAGTRG